MSTTGIGAQSTRPTRRQAREEKTGLASMLSPGNEVANATNDAPAPREPQSSATQPQQPAPPKSAAPQLQSAANKPKKVAFSTQIEIDTELRLEWVIRNLGYKKTDITGAALHALFDSLKAPTADEIRSKQP
ncbi:hypothetical protein GOEFS_108_00090 [Gordonia effusa NBRC 100432]|uniref:Uncharacterized protein n=1 Tax=Gordonia effusa NBRC 100432 TaxID=1077974 RepID=H0R598_9ACTN|nr:hypothetical protein [Gordonia effusa]GAB20249.1 hypothetical protein GOEFS_108_00090 [Gordonia effusa NBRC 100432]